MSNKLYPGETITIVQSATLNDVAISDADVDNVKLTITTREPTPTVALAETNMAWNALQERWEYEWTTPTNYTGFYLAKVTVDGVGSVINWEYKSFLVSPTP